MTDTDSRQASSDAAILLALAAAKFLVHGIANTLGGYGYFRDELYYLACTQHLDLGYVDQPPLSIYILAVSRFLIGDSIFALRLLPAVVGAVVVFLTGRMARELGGGRAAQVFAAVASLVAPIYLGMESIYSMNCFDILFWTLGAFTIIQLVNTENPRYWLLLGAVLGAGLLNKTGVLWLGFGLLVGLVLTPHRRWLRTSWPWLGGLIALVLFLPYIIWNATHDFAHLEFIRNATGVKYSSLDVWSFVTGQVMNQNPVTFPLWVAGLIFLLFVRQGERYRILGIAYLVVFLILVLNGHAKAEYLSPAYGVLFAAGGVMVERLLTGGLRMLLRPAYLFLMAVSGILLIPLAIPILPVETYIRYASALGIAPSTAENKELGKLPQFYADMFGWSEKAQGVANVFHSLSSEEQAKCGVFANNYGRCGAIDFFGASLGLPRSIGNHNNYWLWGPRGYTGEVMIVLGGHEQDHRRVFASVEPMGEVGCEYCMPYEDHLRIYVCRNLTVPLAGLWESLKSYN